MLQKSEKCHATSLKGMRPVEFCIAPGVQGNQDRNLANGVSGFRDVEKFTAYIGEDVQASCNHQPEF